MALATREELTAVWRALSGNDEGTGWRSMAISGLSNSRLMAGRHFPSNDEALLIGFESIVLPVASQLPQASGFRVERAETNRPGDWLALVRQPQGSPDLFSRMVADIVATLAENASADESRQFQVFLGRIRSWQQFMKTGAAGLGPEAELGLVGELSLLDALLDAGIAAHVVVTGWLGPLDGLQDFELGHGAVEVKSTVAVEGFPASILSLEQLDDSVRQPLFVAGCRFRSGTGGTTLPQRIEFMRERLRIDGSALMIFENALLHSGFSDMHSDHYIQCFLATEVLYLLVDSVFPRLTAGSVPAGIRRARYEIDLDVSVGRSHSLDEVIEMIGLA